MTPSVTTFAAGRASPDPNQFTKVMHWLMVAVVVGLSLPATTLSAQGAPFSVPAFEQAWRQIDGPVAAGRVGRPWLWGAAPIAAVDERYDDAGASKQRPALYFDKGRMALSQPDAAGGLATVQSGALVRDLTLGLVQVGSNQTLIVDPAFIPVAGDDGPGENLTAPRYADFGLETVTNIIRRAGLPPPRGIVGQPITATIQAGSRDERAADTLPRVLVGAYDQSSTHNIAAPFWEFFATRGLVRDPFTGADHHAPLFDWRMLIGAPVSEPAWTLVTLGGKPTWLVVQLFEHRVLTYRPDAPEGWRVEMGNVGRHAHRWRYGPASTLVPAVGLAPASKGTSTQRLAVPPMTPTTPVGGDASLPPSLNGAALPGAAAGGVRQLLLARGFRTLNFIDDAVSVWLTGPNGRTIDLNGDGPGPVRIADETADGVILTVDTIRLGVGLWALTLQDYARPDHQSVIYFRVLPGPREAPLTLLLNPLFWLGLTGDTAPSMLEYSLLEQAWQEVAP